MTSPRWWTLAGAAVWIIALLAVAPLVDDVLAQGRPPLWDMAKNGRQAAQLALDLRHLDLLGFVLDLNRHDPWPFAYSLLLLPVLLVAGPSLAAATAAQAALFTLLPVALLWAGREVDPSARGLMAAIPAALLTATSPLLRLHGLLLMREVPGALLTLAALALYLRARRLGTGAAWRWAGSAGLALMLVKYNYGLLVLGTAFLDQKLLRREPLSAPARRALFATLALPLACWFVIPRPAHLRGLFDFLENRSSGLGWREGLEFYPRLFATEYVSAAWWAGALLLALATLGAVLLARRGDGAARSLALLTTLGFALAALHPYKEPRFLATVAPLLLLLGASAAMRLARRAALQVAAALVLCLPALGARDDTARLHAAYRQHSADPRLAQVLEFIRSTAPDAGRFTTLGGFNELSPDLVAWTVVARPQSRAEVQAPLPRGELDESLARRRLDWMVTVRVAATSPFALSDDFRAHTAWQQARLGELEARGWHVGSAGAARRFDDLGLEVGISRRDGA